MFIFKICASILSIICTLFGIAFAIPESRNYILNIVAPYSQFYEQQRNQAEQLLSINELNLDELNRVREALLNAEALSTSYQTELNSVRADLERSNANLEAANNQLALLQADLDVANDLIAGLNTEISNLNAQYTTLMDEFYLLLNNDNTQLIEDLNIQIQDLQADISDMHTQLDDAMTQRDSLQGEIAGYLLEIDNLNQIIYSRDDEFAMLQEQINNQQLEIEQLYEEISYLSGNNTSFSFTSVNNFSLIDELGNTVLSIQNGVNSTISISELMNIDISTLRANSFEGTINHNPIMDDEYGIIGYELSGSLLVQPIGISPYIFLRDPNSSGYMPFNNDNLNSLLSLGYTSLRYTIYAFQLTNGVLTFHLNFIQPL